MKTKPTSQSISDKLMDGIKDMTEKMYPGSTKPIDCETKLPTHLLVNCQEPAPKHILLSQGKIAWVDAEDFEQINQWKWSAHNPEPGRWYAVRRTKDKTIKMHRLIMNPEEAKQVDHIDGNGLNNRKSNLRICTNRQNSLNGKSHKDSTSKYRGVSWCNTWNKWKSQISFDGVGKTIGYFKNEVDAAIAYNNKAKEIHGDFARLNIIEKGSPNV